MVVVWIDSFHNDTQEFTKVMIKLSLVFLNHNPTHKWEEQNQSTIYDRDCWAKSIISRRKERTQVIFHGEKGKEVQQNAHDYIEIALKEQFESGFNKFIPVVFFVDEHSKFSNIRIFCTKNTEIVDTKCNEIVT